jgi:hypothetical protein
MDGVHTTVWEVAGGRRALGQQSLLNSHSQRSLRSEYNIDYHALGYPSQPLLFLIVACS